MVDGIDPKFCCIKGCDKPAATLGLCTKHYRRNRLYGSPVALMHHPGQYKGVDPESRFWSRVRKTSNCWEWQGGRDKDGYGMFRGWIGGTVYRRAHRYSYVLATGHIIGPQDVVMHSCDNPTCVNPAHLSVGTQAENQFEKYRKGRARIPAGEKSVHAKLTEAQATAIMADARPYAEIAAEYGVAPATVGDIKNRKSWKVVENPIVLKAKRRGMRGETQWQARLTADDVRTIRASKESGKELARRFGVSPQTICDIRKGRKWQHVS